MLKCIRLEQEAEIYILADIMQAHNLDGQLTISNS